MKQNFSIFRQSPILKLTTVLFLFWGLPSAAETAVTDTFGCLAKPIKNNGAFIECLLPLENAGVRYWKQEKALGSLTKQANAQTLNLLAKIEKRVGKRKFKRLRQRLNQEGLAFFKNCLVFQIQSEKTAKSLALARCNFDAELFTLHFYYDNTTSIWKAGLH